VLLLFLLLAVVADALVKTDAIAVKTSTALSLAEDALRSSERAVV